MIVKVATLSVFCALVGTIAPAQNLEPLSAIDWLSQSVEDTPNPVVNEPSASSGALAPEVTVTPLGEPNQSYVGLLPPDVSGLPHDLWRFSDEATIIALTQAETMSSLPALQDFLTVMMLAEVDAPINGETHGPLFLSRVDKLLELGAIDQAQALLTQSEPRTPELFRRWFDVALLNGSEDAACDLMQARPAVAPTYPARIFCLARANEWTVAALTLNTHRVLGDVTDEEEQLLSRFLDPDLYEGEANLSPPERISPLVFRMREAIGEGLTTQSLPLAFAHADLRHTTGWKARLEAAERLSRAGVLDPNVLQALYTSRTPSASGGVWERVKAFQRFDNAVQNRAPDDILDWLEPAWSAMKEIKAEVAFATLFAADLQSVPQNALTQTIGLLSHDYDKVSDAGGDHNAFALMVAQGTLPQSPPRNAKQRAVFAAFSNSKATDVFEDLLTQNKHGEAMLRAIAVFNTGLNGDPQSVTEALTVFRRAGHDGFAHRAALQYLLLERSL